MRITGQPALGSAEFPRWLNGDVTRACGTGLHEICSATIRTLGVECPCLCECHVTKVPNESTMQELDNEPRASYDLPVSENRDQRVIRGYADKGSTSIEWPIETTGHQTSG